MSNQSFPSPEDTIPESLAVDITTNWRNYISNIDHDPDYIRAFYIPMEDITSLAQFEKCPGVRAYLAMGAAGDISSLKIILVPVDADNKDVLNIIVPGGSTKEGATIQSAIYDFTTPCPQACDVQSPLFS